MEALLERIEAFVPLNEQEARDREVMCLALKQLDMPLTRDNPFAHFTASAWIVNPAATRVLMVWHNIYQSWSWTGGHADGEADLLKTALREAREETGLQRVWPVSEKIYSLEILPVQAHFKRGRFVSAHLHLNITYLLMADDTQPLRAKPDENSGVRWMPLREAEDNRVEPFMADIYKKLNARLSTRALH